MYDYFQPVIWVNGVKTALTAVSVHQNPHVIVVQVNVPVHLATLVTTVSIIARGATMVSIAPIHANVKIMRLAITSLENASVCPDTQARRAVRNVNNCYPMKEA